MTRSLTALMMVVLTSCVVGLGCHGKGHSTHDKKHTAAAAAPSTLDDLARQHTQGLLKNDLAALDRLWADDFTFIDPRGRLLTKAQRLANLKSGATTLKSIDITELSSRAVGPDAGVTTSRVAIVGQYSGQEGSGDYRAMFVWGRRDGSWKLVALQMTQVAK